MSEIVEKDILDIENMIYEIRGVQVMLDSDLAELYKCKNGTKAINLAVKRNLERFPNDFYFQLREEEFIHICGFKLKPQKSKIRSLPYVFTEQGVAMLATIIRTEIAAQTSIDIMRAFVKMRKYFANSVLSNEMLINHENRLLVLENTLNKFKDKQIDKVFFNKRGESV